MPLSLKLIILAVLLLLSGFFSASETAFFSLSRQRGRRRALHRDPAYRTITALLHQPSRFLATVLIGNEIVNIAISVTTAGLVYSVARDALPGTLLPLLSMLITLPVLLLGGEIIPKTIAVTYPETIARLNAKLLTRFATLIAPLRWALSTAANGLIGLVIRQPHSAGQTDEVFDENVFKSLIHTSHRAGTIDPQERELILRAFRLDDTTVERIMTPRQQMVALQIHTSPGEFAALAREHKYSRYPVYDRSIDYIIGYVHAKDLLPGPPPHPTLQPLLRTPVYIPRSRNVLAALLQLQHHKAHLGVVLNDANQTAGIVTLEDLLEELVGDISDETDLEDGADG